MATEDKSSLIPSWACDPKLENCGLVVKKGDTIIETLTIIHEQKCVIFGRNKVQCDIKLDHPSISRAHAIIAHGSSGNVYLMDLGSSHGTFKNGKRLESKKREALADMDVVKFGASTREYIVRLDLSLPMTNNNSHNHADSPQSLQAHDNHHNHPSSIKVDKASATTGRGDHNHGSNNNNNKRSLATSLATDMHMDSNEADEIDDASKKFKKKVVQVRCSHLLIKHKDSRRPQSWKNPNIEISREEALEKAKEWRKKILAQAKDSDNPKNSVIQVFQEFAARESDCNSYKRGGDLGLFGLGKMQKPFEETAFNLQIGELSQPIETASGVHLILRTQ